MAVGKQQTKNKEQQTKMSNWKIKRSRKAGVIPNVNHFPDADTVIWNQKDGKLWGLTIEDDGTRTVVLIGGGINTIGETHARLHAIDSEDDHLPSSEEDKGKWIRANPDTGKIEYVDPPTEDKHFNININHSAESVIQHNLNKYPAVQAMCEDNMMIISDVEYIDENSVKITFLDLFTGKVVLN